MVRSLQATDRPEPWHSSQKTSATTLEQKRTRSAVLAVKESNVDIQQRVPKRRGRPPGKSTPKLTAVPKGVNTRRPLSASAANVLLGVSQNSVADVEELRRKRQEDAEACGRIVRTILPQKKRSNSPTTLQKYSSEEDRNSDVAAAEDCEARTFPQKCTPVPPSTEEKNGQEGNAIVLLEEATDEGEPQCRRRLGKEPILDDVQDSIPCPERKGNREDRSRGYTAQMEFVPASEDRSPVHRGPGRRRVISPTSNYSVDSPVQGERSYREGIHQSFSRSPRRNFGRASSMSEYRSPERSHTRSPRRRTGGCADNSGPEFQEYYEYPSAHRFVEADRTFWGFHNVDGRRHRRYESSSPGKSRRHSRSPSREHGRSHQQRSRTPYSSMSPPTRSGNSRDAIAATGMGFYAVKDEDIVETSLAIDRRRWRHKQAFLEAEKAKRQRNGSKPFYLTLDREGRPYGPGKPSWITEINKLAAGLDPSCTHIRKQTFEDVQTFKDRLDDSFEYSATLNEDYLRALMGKAVTKRRSELVALINNSGTQPVHIDHQVWHRLRNLATNKQREEKSEQGRYANACRRTIGRTGRKGIDGVREKLCSLFGRSPNPSEVEEEMQRDKGYGRGKRENRICHVKEETNSTEVVLLDEDIQDRRTSRRNSSPNNSEAIYVEAYEHHGRGVAQKRGRGAEGGLQEVDVVPRMTEKGQNSFTLTKSKEISKDDYIAQLEAQIQLLQEETANASNSNTKVPSQSATSNGTEQESE